MFVWGKSEAEVPCFLIGPRVDMGIAMERVRSVGVEVSIAKGILMFIWGRKAKQKCCVFTGPRVDMGIAQVKAKPDFILSALI